MRVVIADALGVFRAGVRNVVLSEGDCGVAEAVEAYEGVPYRSTEERLLRVLGPVGPTDLDAGADPGPGTVRNALVGALFAAGAVGA